MGGWNTMAGCYGWLLWVVAIRCHDQCPMSSQVLLTRAAKEHGVIQMCPTLASCTLDEMTSAARGGQTQFFQLYVNHDKEVS